jgi:hypothetical protein
MAGAQRVLQAGRQEQEHLQQKQRLIMNRYSSNLTLQEEQGYADSRRAKENNSHIRKVNAQA